MLYPLDTSERVIVHHRLQFLRKVSKKYLFNKANDLQAFTFKRSTKFINYLKSFVIFLKSLVFCALILIRISFYSTAWEKKEFIKD